MVGTFWLSSPRMTVRVRVRGKIIIDAAPVVRVFIGQPLPNLVQWLQRQGDVRIEFLGKQHVTV